MGKYRVSARWRCLQKNFQQIPQRCKPLASFAKPCHPEPGSSLAFSCSRRLHWHQFIRDASHSMQGQLPGEDIAVATDDTRSKPFRVLLRDELLVIHISEDILGKKLFASSNSRCQCLVPLASRNPCTF